MFMGPGISLSVGDLIWREFNLRRDEVRGDED